MNVTVIGAGVVGMSAALILQREGLRVSVVDPCVKEARCSYGNAGAISASSVAPLALPGILRKTPSMLADPAAPLRISPFYLPRATPWLVRFVLSARPSQIECASNALAALFADSYSALEMLAKESGAEDLIRRTGQLHLYPDAESCRADDRSWSIRRRRGHECLALGPREIAELEPDLDTAYRCGVFLPNDGMIADPQGYLDRLTATFVEKGGVILQDEVRAVSVRAKTVSLETRANRRLAAERLLVAAGAWSARLARQLGSKVPLETQRGYHVMLPHAMARLSRPVTAADRKCFLTPMRGGLRIAGTVEFAGLKAPPDPRRADFLIEHSKALLPSLSTAGATTWMGHRPCLPDSLPVISRSPVHGNIFYAFGHGHLGLTGSASTGRHMADLIMGRTPAIDLRPFSIDRF